MVSTQMTAAKTGAKLKVIAMVTTIFVLSPLADGGAFLSGTQPIVTADQKTKWIRHSFAYQDMVVTLNVPAGGRPPVVPERYGIASFVSPYVLWRAYGTTRDDEPRFLLKAVFFGRESSSANLVTAEDMTKEALQIGVRVAAEKGPPMPGAREIFAGDQWHPLDAGQRRWFLTDPSRNREYVVALTVASDRWLLMISGTTIDRSKQNNEEYRKVLEKVLSTVEIAAVNN